MDSHRKRLQGSRLINAITIVVLIFSFVGAADWLLGIKIGMGKEFEKAFSLFCPMVLSMLGMIVGKIVSGICAVFLALLIYKEDVPKREE